MPAYLSMKLMFIQQRIKSGFVKNIYQQIIQAGFDFLGEFDDLDDDKPTYFKTTLKDISDYNQTHLEERFRLDFPKKDDQYKPILFQREGYSELRGIWYDFNNHPVFDLSVPEEDVLFYNNGVHYIQEKITPFITLAKTLYEKGLVDVVATELECDDPPYGFSDILNGRDIWFRPFAIIPESRFGKFPKDYFAGADISKIPKNGIFIEQFNDSKRVKYFKETVILASEPLHGFTPDDVRKWLGDNDTEQGLATALAKAHNQADCCRHDLFGLEGTAYKEAEVIFCEWQKLRRELYKKAERLLYQENMTGKADHYLSGGRIRDIIMPFMDRNGYRDGADWWLPNKD